MSPSVAALSPGLASQPVDLPGLAVAQLRRHLSRRHDAAVLADAVEEDLRASLDSLETLRAHLEEVLRALLLERPAPLDLLEASDDAHAQAALVALESALGSLRQRLSQAAQRVASRPR